MSGIGSILAGARGECNTWIKNGYVSKQHLERVKNCLGNVTISQSDALLICTTYNIYDIQGQTTDQDILYSIQAGFNETISRMNMRKGMDMLTDEYQLLSILLGFNEMCNVSNAMACGATLYPQSTVDGNGKLCLAVETGMDKLWTSQAVDDWKRRHTPQQW